MTSLTPLVKENRPVVLFLLLLLLIYVIIVFSYSLNRGLFKGSDTRDFYYISHLLTQKSDPYRMTIDYVENASRVDWRELEKRGGRGLYPPSTQAMFTLFFAFLPSADAATITWCLWNIVFLIVIFNVIRKYLEDAPLLYHVLLLLIVFGAYATKSCLSYGQTSLYSFSFFLLALNYRSRNKWLSGIFFAFACGKPSLMALFTLYLLFQKEFRIVLISIFIHITLTAVVAAWIGSSPVILMQNYFNKVYLLAYNNKDLWWIYQVNGISLRSILNLIGTPEKVMFTVKLSLYSFCIIMIYLLRKHPETIALSFVALMTLLIDFHWHYDFIILLFMYPIIVKALMGSPRYRWLLFYFIFLMFIPNLFRTGFLNKRVLSALVAWQSIYTLMYVALGCFVFKLVIKIRF